MFEKGSLSAPKRPHPDAKVSRELWDEAYDSLRSDPSTMSLVVTYESIISQQLPDDLKLAAHGSLSSTDGETGHRLDLMKAIASVGLNKRRGSRTSQVDEISWAILDQSKNSIERQLVDFPSASLAWSGICTLSPVSIQAV